jgi:predicted dehydrogenase
VVAQCKIIFLAESYKLTVKDFFMTLQFAVFGAGFWSRFQMAGWREAGGAECVAICDPDRSRAESLAQMYGVPRVYTDPQALLDAETLDFVDIVTPVETHAPLIRLAAERGLNVVCQKPLGVDLQEAEATVNFCHDKGIMLLVNENWRWQYPLRQFKQALDAGRIGQPFRARIHYASSFPVFDNQPFLKTLEQFILTDIGSHILDVARFLFGDAHNLYCQIHRVHPDIKGEDVATVMMNMGANITVTCEMSYASRTEIERFPETYVYVEGSTGFLELGPDFWIRETTEAGTFSKRHVPPHYAWADPAYDLIHSSIVPCHANLLRGLRGGAVAETNADDNLRTCQLYFGAYESAKQDVVLKFGYKYRMREYAAWGIAIDIQCTIFNKETYQGASIHMLSCVDLALIPGWSTDEQFINSFRHGLKLIEKEFCALISEPIVIQLKQLDFNPADFQEEGLGYALAGWVIQEYGLKVELPLVHYDKENNRYIYPYEV